MALRKAVLAALAFLLVPLLAPAAVQANPNAFQPYHLAYQGRMVTDVFIDGKGPFTFLIDTASSHSIVYEHLRAQLGLARVGAPITIFGINAATQAIPVRPDSLEVAGESIKGLTVGVLPDSEQGKDPDGVLGIDVLSRYFVVLDRRHMQFRLLAPGTQNADDYADWVAVPLEPRPLKIIPVNFWYITTVFKDQPINCLFDLGSGLTLFNWDAAARLGYEQRDFLKLGPPPDKLRDALGQTAPVVLLTGMRVDVGTRQWLNREVLVSDAPVFQFFDLDDHAGAIVGPGLLHDNSLAIDFAGHKLYIGPTVYR
jgi:predicted aspartyl protease